MQPSDFDNQEEPRYLLVSRESGPSAIPLEPNNSLFVGTGANCRIALTGEDVQPIHCMLWMEGETVRVQDWNTGGKTILNGQPIDAETELESGDELQIGQNRIVPVLTRQFHQQVRQHLSSHFTNAPLENDTPPAVASEPKPTAVDCPQANITHLGELANALDEYAPQQSEPNPSPPQNSLSQPPQDSVSQPPQDSLSPDSSPSPDSPSPDSPLPDSPSPDLATAPLASIADDTLVDEWDSESKDSEWDTESSDFDETGSESDGEATFDYDADFGEDAYADLGFDDDGFDSFETSSDTSGSNEELVTLRMEVEQLRFELAERDAQDIPAPPAYDDSMDDDQTIKLVNRLEELLDELKHSDDRVRGLEELLRVSDQATQAEQEERQQLESWVTEIEQRVSQRESESDAQLKRVTARLNEVKTQGKRAHQQLKKVLRSKSTNQASTELAEKFRAQIEELQQKLDAVAEENERLQRQSLCDEKEAEAREELRLMEQKLLAVQVETSRERAEMSRQRAELERLKDELEEKLSSAKKLKNDDSRVQAMRQHLRDIHEEEKCAEQEKKQRGLGGRISRLLNRVGN